MQVKLIVNCMRTHCGYEFITYKRQKLEQLKRGSPWYKPVGKNIRSLISKMTT